MPAPQNTMRLGVLARYVSVAGRDCSSTHTQVDEDDEDSLGSHKARWGVEVRVQVRVGVHGRLTPFAQDRGCFPSSRWPAARSLSCQSPPTVASVIHHGESWMTEADGA